MKEYWGVQHGGNRASGQNGHLKTRQDIADAIGEDERTTRRLLKLNDLIPELQSLVSAGKLGTTAAEQLAYLTPDVQRQLLALKGDLSGTSVEQAKEYRKQAKEAEEEGVDFASADMFCGVVCEKIINAFMPLMVVQIISLLMKLLVEIANAM